jgi:undecaprenyl-diphosphatase
MEILSRLHRYDLHLLVRIFGQGRRPTVIPFAKTVSRSGDGYLHVLFPVLLWGLNAPGSHAFLGLLMPALLLERALYFALKNSLRRQRPQEAVRGFTSLITASDQFSFPSGHSSAAFLLATSLVLVYGWPVAIVYLWAFAVAFSRILLGVHFPGDTLAGAVMGISIALLSAQLPAWWS